MTVEELLTKVVLAALDKLARWPPHDAAAPQVGG